MPAQAVRPGLDGEGRQVVEVSVHRGYRPDSIRARAGLPLRIVFHREDEDACSERVVFSAPHLDRRLAATGPTTIDLPAQPPGEVRFTCGMGRYRGRIELVDESERSILTRVHSQAGRIEARLGTVLVLWICSLPLIALVAVLASYDTAVLAAAGAVLVAWVAISLWALGRSAQSS